MLAKSVHKLRLQTRYRSFLPDYVRNKTPLLGAARAPLPGLPPCLPCGPLDDKSPALPCDTVTRHPLRASLATALVVLPFAYIAYTSGIEEACAVLAILPMMPFFFIACVVMPAAFVCIQTAWPGIVIVGVAGFVFLCFY